MKKYFALFLLIFIAGCESSNLVDPSCEISYGIVKDSHVKLTIVNSYNTLIKVLVDEDQNAGMYSVQFDGSRLAEGVYFYTVEAKGINSDYYLNETKYLLLVK